jgi:hypothetical protein
MADDDKSRQLPVSLNLGGRPSGYDSKYCTLVRRLALLGLANTTRQLAVFFGVSERTIYYWKSQFPEFLQAIREGQLPADALVAERMFERACGYEWIEEQAFKVKETFYSESGKKLKEREDVKVIEVIKRLPPDPTAGKFWLTNRQGEIWKGRPAVVLGSDLSVPPEDRPRTLAEIEQERQTDWSQYLPKKDQGRR